ncbi:hypothetical protein SDC9_199445 [bioreactor metagenome]|uniref:Uncharacterized protein n=1 Tax=bioreactor metagenome TaxID=1076179 RepID=A0A645IL96_9ZZZZ
MAVQAIGHHDLRRRQQTEGVPETHRRKTQVEIPALPIGPGRSDVQ